MRVVPIKTTASTGASDVFEPRTNTVGMQVAIEATGAVEATFQVQGRSMPNMPLENIGSPVTISGTNTAAGSVTVEQCVAGELLAVFSLASCTSLSCVAVEADNR